MSRTNVLCTANTVAGSVAVHHGKIDAGSCILGGSWHGLMAPAGFALCAGLPLHPRPTSYSPWGPTSCRPVWACMVRTPRIMLLTRWVAYLLCDVPPHCTTVCLLYYASTLPSHILIYRRQSIQPFLFILFAPLVSISSSAFALLGIKPPSMSEAILAPRLIGHCKQSACVCLIGMRSRSLSVTH